MKREFKETSGGINTVGSVALWLVLKGMNRKERIRFGPTVALTIIPLRAHLTAIGTDFSGSKLRNLYFSNANLTKTDSSEINSLGGVFLVSAYGTV
ncbi:MAG: pentapeptide repeat-containing protein [Rhizobiaceae bacterium]